jgi:hypothetical protein
MTLSLPNAQYNSALHSAENRALFIVMLGIIMLNVIMVSVIMLNVIMLNVLAPYYQNYNRLCCLSLKS